ncbi:MAG: CobW family GTP-binding protein [Candidatus Binatia bacterium]
MSSPRVPLTLITGFLGSGKTTLCRRFLATGDKKIAFLINEFGEIALDSKVLHGQNILMTELAGGCVCCSLIGEFEAALAEILARVRPDIIVVETTGLAEPDALAFDVQENLPAVRLDGVITVCDAESMQRFPELGHTTRLQIEAADLMLLNKVDLVSEKAAAEIQRALTQLNDRAPVVRCVHCRVDQVLLFGIGQEKNRASAAHRHQPEFESFSYTSPAILDRARFARFADRLPQTVYRAKGFVRFSEGAQLFNFVAGHWDLEPLEAADTELVFLGKTVCQLKHEILAGLKECER